MLLKEKSSMTHPTDEREREQAKEGKEMSFSLI